MADLNRKAIFDLAEIELLAKINNWKMNMCGIPPENKIDLWIKESQCRRSQLLPKLMILSKMLRILKRDICQEYIIKMELNDQISLILLWIPTFYCALCYSLFHVIIKVEVRHSFFAGATCEQFRTTERPETKRHSSLKLVWNRKWCW